MKRSWKILDLRHMGGALLVGGALACGAQAQTPGALPLDTPTTVDGIETVCTGVAVNPEDMPRWNAYPLKVVVTGKGGQFLAGEQVTVSKRGRDVVSVICDGPWALFKLAPGEYRVRATVDGKSAVSLAHAPKTGQGRVQLRFPNLGGEISPERIPGHN
ncbi:MAG: hypothetical protein ABSD21_08460 [Rhizomicrobium sp.]|jgi:hypothetical protein